MKKTTLAIACLSYSLTAFAAENFKALDSSSFGEDWPLTFKAAKVSCVNKNFVFVYNTETNERYPLNGTAKGLVSSGKMKGSDIDSVWSDDPNYKGVKKSLSPILDAGLALCDQ